MAYALTFLALLSVFLWVTPARQFVADNARTSAAAIERVAASGSAPLMLKVNGLKERLRVKAMELLRKELHQSVDSLVQ